MKTLDIVTSAFNEEGNIAELYKQIKEAMSLEREYKWQLLIADNGSTDNTWDEIRKITQISPNVKGYRLSKNFGFEGAIKSGLDKSESDAIVIMTSDLQDSPEDISKFLREFENGYDNVYQIVTKRPGISLLRKLNSAIFYILAEKLSNGQIPKNVSEFRLISKRLNHAMRELPERNRFLRGIVAWTGFKSIGVPFPRQPRLHGKSKAFSSHVVNLGVKGILVNSYTLLNYVAVFGLAVSALAFLSTLFFAFVWIVHGTPFAGFGMLVGINLLGFGIVMLTLGIISQYLALMYEEQKARPSYIIMDEA
jgi:glycosyltransferase involved in cell wall biosynthesis